MRVAHEDTACPGTPVHGEPRNAHEKSPLEAGILLWVLPVRRSALLEGDNLEILPGALAFAPLVDFLVLFDGGANLFHVDQVCSVVVGVLDSGLALALVSPRAVIGLGAGHQIALLNGEDIHCLGIVGYGVPEIALRGKSSDFFMNTRNDYVSNIRSRSEVLSSKSESDMAYNVRMGNEGVESGLDLLNQTVTRILNKRFETRISPSSALARTVKRSEEMRQSVSMQDLLPSCW